MVKMTLAEALEKIRQGCTTLDLGGACSGAPPHPRGTAKRARACMGGVRPAAPSALLHALAAPTARARVRRCGGGGEGRRCTHQ